MVTVVYNDIAFNADLAVKRKEADFIAHEKHHDLTDAELKEVYALCVAKVKNEPKAEPVKPDVKVITEQPDGTVKVEEPLKATGEGVKSENK